jgi:hypothetical protein
MVEQRFDRANLAVGLALLDRRPDHAGHRAPSDPNPHALAGGDLRRQSRRERIRQRCGDRDRDGDRDELQGALRPPFTARS